MYNGLDLDSIRTLYIIDVLNSWVAITEVLPYVEIPLGAGRG